MQRPSRHPCRPPLRALLQALAASAVLVGPPLSDGASTPRLPHDALGVPLVRQQTDYSCGAAAMAMALRYFDAWDGPEEELYAVLGTHPEHGTLPEDMVPAAERFGLQAELIEPMSIGQLRTALRDGKIAILEIQALRPPERLGTRWRDVWDDGHYVVLVAMDEHYVYLSDPSTEGAYTYMPIGELLDRWHDINPVRSDPEDHRDESLAVVIGDSRRRSAHRPVTHSVVRQE